VVYGMPRVAVLRGGARESLPLDAIGSRLQELSAARVVSR
jgi:chemotaxis response regulator CheB